VKTLKWECFDWLGQTGLGARGEKAEERWLQLIAIGGSPNEVTELEISRASQSWWRGVRLKLTARGFSCESIGKPSLVFWVEPMRINQISLHIYIVLDHFVRH
jgi:hypothetical protein